VSSSRGFMGILVVAFSVLADASGARADSLSGGIDLAPPPAEPASVCTASFGLGSPTSCKPQAAWYEHAKSDCAARGYTAVGSLSPANACWKGFRSVDYTCCN
jgi:hypothetical protein